MDQNSKDKSYLGLQESEVNPLMNLGDISYPKYNFDDRFTDLEVKKFSEIFAYLDRDGNNQLRVSDLGLAMRAMGSLITDKEVTALA